MNAYNAMIWRKKDGGWPPTLALRVRKENTNMTAAQCTGNRQHTLVLMSVQAVTIASTIRITGGLVSCVLSSTHVLATNTGVSCAGGHTCDDVRVYKILLAGFPCILCGGILA